MKVSQLLKATCLSALIGVTFGCGADQKRGDHLSETTPTQASPGQEDELASSELDSTLGVAPVVTYIAKIKPVLTKKCLACHSGAISGVPKYTTLALTKASYAKIVAYVNAGLMPKAPLTMTVTERKAFLKNLTDWKIGGYK